MIYFLFVICDIIAKVILFKYYSQLKLMSCWDSVADDRPTFSELIEFFATKKETEYEHL